MLSDDIAEPLIVAELCSATTYSHACVSALVCALVASVQTMHALTPLFVKLGWQHEPETGINRSPVGRLTTALILLL